MKNFVWRRGAGAVLAALTALALVPLAAAPSGAVASFAFQRLEGADRFGTAADIAVRTFGTAPDVLVARGDLFPDALAGSYLSGATGTGAPILLTLPGSVPQATLDALTTLRTARVILLGGPAAISEAVANQLRQRGLTVERVGGADRYETARLVAERPGANRIGSPDGRRSALLASGRNFPDALAAGPLAFDLSLPIFLTEPAGLPATTKTALQQLGITRVFILGGPAAVSEAVAAELAAMNIGVERFGGADRQETAVVIAEAAIARFAFSREHVNLARGDAFADALTGGPHAGFETGPPGNAPAPILLTGSPTVLGGPTRSFLQKYASTLRDGHVFGGPSAVSPQVVDEAEVAAGATRDRVRVTLDAGSTPEGGTVTGTLTGSPTRVLVSGCGISERELSRDSNGRFSIALPSSQRAGTCTLTFRSQFSDGTTETDTKDVTVTKPLEAATASPELISATVVRTFAAPNPTGTPATFDQTTVRYTFDEPVTGIALISQNPNGTNNCFDNQDGCSEKFRLYSYDQTPNNTTTNNNPDRVYSGRAAQVDPDDSRSVLVSFGTLASPVGTEELGEISVAGVLPRAVADTSSPPSGFEETRFNPPGDAALSAVSFGVGQTSAPDLLRVDNFRPNPGTAGGTLVDFTFDEPAVFVRATNPSRQGEGFHLVLNDEAATVKDCSKASNSSTSGDGKATITVACGFDGTSQISPSRVARGYVDPGTVASPGNTANGATSGTDNAKYDQGEQNPLQAVDVTDGATTGADLVSATFSAGTSSYDEVTYTFDEPVILPTGGERNGLCTTTASTTASCFAVYLVDGGEAFGQEVQDAAGPPPTYHSPRRPDSNSSQVIVRFPDGTLDLAVGASVRRGAVLEGVGSGGQNRTNEPDAVAVQGVAIAEGTTTGPDLVSCRRDVTQVNPITGAPEAYQLVFRFDEPIRATDDTSTTVNESINESRIHVYRADGSKIGPRTSNGTANGSKAIARRAAPNENEIVLSGYQNRDDILAIATCGVEEAAVYSTASPAEPNPVGYEVIS